jgi:hypothetical protein
MAATVLPNDIRYLMNAMQTPTGKDTPEDSLPEQYDVEQLDFSFVENCNDPHHLRKLLAVLR